MVSVFTTGRRPGVFASRAAMRGILVALFGAAFLATFAFVYALECEEGPSAFCLARDGAQKVVVVGGGLAGLSAAVEAIKEGAKVVLVEKEPRLGGNSAKATSGINGAPSVYQEKLGIQDSVESFAEDTLTSGHSLSKESLVNVLVGNSRSAIDWVSAFGLDLSSLTQLGGHSAKRTHRQPPREDGKPTPIGFNIVSALEKYIRSLESDRITIMTDTRLKKLLEEGEGPDRKVVGVEVTTADGQTKEIKADAVVLATGGFGNDHTETSLLKEFVPKIATMPTTNGVFAQGDGVKAARALGAALIHMDQVQLHPTAFIDPKDPHNAVKFLGPEALRGSGGILVNGKGERFVNELGRRDDVSAAMFAQGTTMPGVEDSPIVAYLLMNDDSSKLFGLPNLNFYKSKGLIRPTTTEKVAAEIGADPKVLANTLDSYGKDDPFGKKVFPVTMKSSDPLWVATVTPAIHYCMGGVAMDESACLLRDGQPIAGLYGAGEVTGGLHGGNRLGGNSLLECVVFGRIAGQSAARGPQAL